MRYKKSDIKSGYWVCLDGMPWFPDAHSRGEDRRTIADMKLIFPPKFAKANYFKVTRVTPLTYQYKISGTVSKEKFYLKWVTDVQSSYNDVIKVRKGIINAN